MIAIDFKISVFLAAAKHLNFTKASQELSISQPAVSKNIHELELQAGRNLFERTGSRLMLTEAGQLMFNYAQQLYSVYEQLNENLEILDGGMAGSLNLGTSATLSNYIIPQILADFHVKFPAIKIKTLHGNSSQVEEMLQQKVIDLGIVEGLSDNISMKYVPFFKDELVLVTRSKNPLLADQTVISPSRLKNFEFVFREPGSGANEIIRRALMKIGIEWNELNIKVILSSVESIKSFLLNTDCFSFLSIHAVAKELDNDDLQLISLQNFEIDRDFFFVRPQGVIGRLADSFKKFAAKYIAEHRLK